MLPNGKIVERVYEDDVIGHAPTDALLLDCSTIDVDTAKTVNGYAANQGYAMSMRQYRAALRQPMAAR